MMSGNVGRSRPAFAPFLPLQFRSQANPISPVTPLISMALQVGQRVRVAKPVVMYHYPSKKNTPVDVEGFEGVIIRDISILEDTEMTATAPYIVQFPDHPRFKAHFQENELELI